MGHKVHPTGFRIAVIRDWQAKWYADKHYADFLHEDLKLRNAIKLKYSDAAVSAVEVERQVNQVAVTIHTARPGIVIGRGGQRVDEMRHHLEDVIGKKVQLNIREIQQPELDAFLVARTIAEQIERRIVYRRAMKQAMFRTMQAGAKGMRVNCAGRLGGAEIARRLSMHEGQVPLHTLRADIDYGFTEAHTAMGLIGIKVWIYKGEILPELKVEGAEEAEAAAPVEAVAVAEPAAEVKLVEAVVEEKPAEAPAAPRRRTRKVVAEPAAEAVTEPAVEKPAVEAEAAKPVVRRRTRKPIAEAAPSPSAEDVAEVKVTAEAEEPPKPVRRRAKKAASEPKAEETEEKPE